MDTNSFMMIPDLELEELSFLKNITRNLDESQLRQFIFIYSSRRKSPQTILICTLLGLIIVAGVQRFVTNNIGLGLLYLFTGGLCLIGTIVDLVNYKQIANTYNQKQAIEVLELQKISY